MVRLARSYEVLNVFVLDLIAQKLRLITSFILFPGADSLTRVTFYMFYELVPGRSLSQYCFYTALFFFGRWGQGGGVFMSHTIL